ncbi:MAG: hypothetical protein R2741_13055 [Methanolobus sp.]
MTILPVIIVNSINGTTTRDQYVYTNSGLLVNVSEVPEYGNATIVDLLLSSNFNRS